MAQHGGYREPKNPAPASGPGALSRRTDGGPAQKLRPVTGLPYGQNQELNGEQAAAPLAQTPGPSATPAAGRRQAAGGPGLPPFSAPTAQPDVPVTAGAAAGPGPGPEALGAQPPAGQAYQSALTTLQSVAAASGSPEVQALLNRMQSRN